MKEAQRKALLFFARNLGWLMGGIAATGIPLVIAGLLIVNGVQRELAVIICFGVMAVCGEHMMNKFVRTATTSNLMHHAAKFLGCAAAYVLCAPYVARNICLLAAPDEINMARIASFLIVIVVGFQTAWLFQNLVNTEAK